MNRNPKYLFLLALLGLVLVLGLVLWWMRALEHRTSVVFLNVGQGDAILISQGSHQVVIDGGRDGQTLLSRLGRHMPFLDRRIEMLIATHPDTDHIGGFPALLRAYRVEQILTTGAQSETDASRLFQEAIQNEIGTGPTIVYRGAKLAFPEGGLLEIDYPLRPLPADMQDTNQGSIVARFLFGETSFLLTGDLADEELALPDIKAATVLKVAHHGSKSSTSARFLELVQPKEAVISVGENSYGHPHPGVLDRLRVSGALIRRTDLQGDIVYRCLSERNACVSVP